LPPHARTHYHYHTERDFGVVAFKLAKCSDGDILISRCHQCPCTAKSVFTEVSWEADFLHTSKEHVQQFGRLHCAAAEELLTFGLGGEGQLRDLLSCCVGVDILQ
jgi:hypothetical protein